VSEVQVKSLRQGPFVLLVSGLYVLQAPLVTCAALSNFDSRDSFVWFQSGRLDFDWICSTPGTGPFIDRSADQ
jgi:hypothetical protein